MDISNLNSCLSQSVRVRIAQREDALRIRTLINSAFRPAEGFFVDADRVDVEGVLNFLDTGKFLLAESDPLLLGCVYVEPRALLINGGSPVSVNRKPDDLEKEVSDLAGVIRNSQSEIHNPKFSSAYIGLLAVDPGHQQSGLGTMLMDAAEDYCRGLGASIMDIKVVSLREELFGFYRRRGYVEIGTSPFPQGVATKLSCHFIEMSKALNNDSQNDAKLHKVT